MRDTAANLIFREGYFKALVDVANWIDRHSVTLNHDRRRATDMAAVMQAFIDEIDYFMDYADTVDVEISKEKKRTKAVVVKG